MRSRPEPQSTAPIKRDKTLADHTGMMLLA